MSSFEGMNTDCGTDAGIDFWRVQLGTGEVRAMSLDALDDAFQSGLIDESTPVLAPGTTQWSKLADVAGLEAPSPAPDANVPSVAPLAVSVREPAGDAASFTNFNPSPTLDVDDLDKAEGALKSKKGLFIGMAVAAVAVLGLGFAATRAVGAADSAASSLSIQGGKKAAAIAPPAAADEEAREANLRALTEEQRLKLLEADKAREAREAQKKKDRPAPPPPRKAQPKSGNVFNNGGSKFDPLNGAL